MTTVSQEKIDEMLETLEELKYQATQLCDVPPGSPIGEGCKQRRKDLTKKISSLECLLRKI